jgi:hypothetical protein
MQENNIVKYTALVLCMLNENSLSEDNLNDDNGHFVQLKKRTLSKCRLKQNTDTFKFIDALNTMEGTYTKKCCMQYIFV